MQISRVPPNQEEVTNATTNWLISMLDNPQLGGAPLPGYIRGYIYVDGIAKQLAEGYWQVSSDAIHLARVSSSSGAVGLLDRLAILSSIASITGAIANPLIVDKIAARLVTCIQDTTRTVYSSIIQSTAKPSRLAIDNKNCRIATEINGTWYLTGGAPIEVDSTWITMDF